MNFRFAPRALREAERKKKWWRANRLDAPDLFDEEIAAAIEQICRGAPNVGALYPSSFGRAVRKVLMPTTKNHVYYTVKDGEAVILSVWGAPREHGPKL